MAMKSGGAGESMYAFDSSTALLIFDAAEQFVKVDSRGLFLESGKEDGSADAGFLGCPEVIANGAGIVQGVLPREAIL